MKPIPWNAKLWKESVTQFLEFLNPLIAGLGRSERRVAATRYVEGLLMPGQRKSIIPMAERLGVDSQSLQQFVTDSPWSEEALWRAIRQEIIPHLEPLEAWVVDETGWVKQGSHSVGVGHQYCGAVGKQANCQVSVEVVVSDGWIAAPVGGRLYLPESWTQDPERCEAAGVPEEVEFATLAELTNRIPAGEWKKCAWVTAGGQTRCTRLAWRQVFLQHDLRQAGGELEKVWLVVDWPAGDPEPYHYYLAHLHRPPTKARCLKLSRSRWHIEQYFQRSKADLGLDHFEGRSWRGFHHHLVLSAVAYLFILTVYLRRKKNFWCDVGTDSPHDPALAGEMERTLSLLRNEVQANL